jgi:hypothetical protein
VLRSRQGGALHCTIAHTFDLDFILNVQLLAVHPCIAWGSFVVDRV